MPQFSGFPAEGLAFFRQLKKNNTREWFQPRKHIFEEKLKAPMTGLVEQLNAAMAKFAPDHVTDPAKAIYRIYRDTRFSKDKTPYKTHIAAIFRHRALEKHSSAGLYFGVSAESVEIAGGVYMPGPDQLRILRHLLAERYQEYGRITSAKTLAKLMGQVQGEQLTRVPKGFPATHPAEDLLRRKQWYFYVTLDGSIATTPKLFTELLKRFEVMTPFLDFMNAPLLARHKRDAAARRLAAG
jgi:uncharacterized protein (TIGR02453 family)